MVDILYEIRDGTMDDAQDIRELSEQLGYPASESEIISRLESILGSDDHMMCVAVQPDGKVIAWIHVFKCQTVESGRFAEISGFIVDEAYRGKGVGKQLLEVAEQWTSHKKLPKLRVRSRIEREDAKAFYSKMGFSVSKNQSVFDKPMDNKVRHRRSPDRGT